MKWFSKGRADSIFSFKKENLKQIGLNLSLGSNTFASKPDFGSPYWTCLSVPQSASGFIRTWASSNPYLTCADPVPRFVLDSNSDPALQFLWSMDLSQWEKPNSDHWDLTPSSQFLIPKQMQQGPTDGLELRGFTPSRSHKNYAVRGIYGCQSFSPDNLGVGPFRF